MHLSNLLLKRFIALILFPLKYFITKGNIVILQTYSNFIYCENTKYLYEYLSVETNLDVYWHTDNLEIQRYLDSKGFKYITRKNIFHLIFVTLRAKFVIDSGTGYFDIFNLITNNVIKITTMHGNGPKSVNIYDLNNFNEAKYKLTKFDYVNFPSEYSKNKIGKDLCQLHSDSLVNLGYPRCDQFFDKSAIKESYIKKKSTKYLCSSYKSGGKIILYTPTWRQYEYAFPLLELKSFNWLEFDEYLLKGNIYFFFTIHTAKLPSNFYPPDLKRIKYINHRKYPFYDVNEFMMEVDILINDYSTTSTDYSLLRRPQIFFMPDYEKFEKVNGFVENFRDVMPGQEISTFAELLEVVDYCLKEPDEYVQKYKQEMELLLEHYNEMENGNSCKDFSDFISQKI